MTRYRSSPYTHRPGLVERATDLFVALGTCALLVACALLLVWVVVNAASGCGVVYGGEAGYCTWPMSDWGLEYRV